MSPFSPDAESPQAAGALAAPSNFPPVREAAGGAPAAPDLQDRDPQREDRLEDHDLLGKGVAEGAEEPGQAEDAEEVLVEAGEQAELAAQEEQERVGLGGGAAQQRTGSLAVQRGRR